MSYIENKKEQRAKYKREWHQKNKERRLEEMRLRNREIRDWFHDYKTNLKCEKCGFSHPAALDFHHRDESDKDNSVCKLVDRKCSKEKILSEIEKCDVLCSNCHRILHYNQRREDCHGAVV